VATEAIMAGFGQRIDTLARAVSFGTLLLFALITAALALWNAYNGLYGTLSAFEGSMDHHSAQLLVLSAAVVLGLISACFFAALKRKLAQGVRDRDGAPK
jgi:hypothetical protein